MINLETTMLTSHMVDLSELKATGVHYGGPNYSHGAFVRVYINPNTDLYYVFDVAADYGNNGNMYDGGYGPSEQGFVVGPVGSLELAEQLASDYYTEIYG